MVQFAEAAARPGVRLQLLTLKLEVKRPRGIAVLRTMGLAVPSPGVPDRPQRRLSHRPGLSGTGLYQQQFFFYTYAPDRH
jgi:hypothetical protein